MQRSISVQRLRELDPDYAASIERNDWYRLKRALDICTLSGRSATLTLLNSHRMKIFTHSPEQSHPSRRSLMKTVRQTLLSEYKIPVF